MTELPALREAIRVTAERRYGRRRRLRPETLGAALVAAAGVALLALIIAPALSGDDREVAVTAPAPAGEVEVLDPASVRDDRAVRRGLPTGGGRPRLVRAWSVPALGGRAYLTRIRALWCLSVPVAGGDPEVNRASGCETPQRYRRVGIMLTFGTSERGRPERSVAAVVPRGARAPLVTDARGERRRLRLVGGLGVVGRVPEGTVIVSAGGQRLRPGASPLAAPTPVPSEPGDRTAPPATTPVPGAPTPTPTP